VIDRRVVGIIGTTQLVMWGVSYYLIGIFGPAIERELRWPQPWIYGGFSVALLAMGVVSPFAGRAVDRHGGSRTMATGCVLVAVACCGIAASHSVAAYYAAWLLMGASMRLTLYDAAFAALARRGGAESRRAMSQVTIFGALASTVFWPIGSVLLAAFGWRTAVLVYAAIALSMAWLLLRLPPEGRPPDPGSAASPTQSISGRPEGARAAAWLFALITALIAFLNTGMSSHMIAMLTGLGIGLGSAVWVSAFRGFGQVAGRLGELLFAGRLHPTQVNLVACLLIPGAFALLALGGAQVVTALLFALTYGLGNGIATITRGSLPLVLFGAAGYGALVGRLLVPSFVLSAAAPLVYAEIGSLYGGRGTAYLSVAVSLVTLGASVGLAILTRRRPAAPTPPERATSP
jgi:MFS family permease